MAKKPENIEQYQKNYDESSFWDKLKETAAKAGQIVIAKVLLLYYAIDSMSAGEKALVIGALGYFILPLDLIPDFYPVVGFSDDLAALAFVFAKVGSHIGPDAKRKAREQMKKLYKDISDQELTDLGM